MSQENQPKEPKLIAPKSTTVPSPVAEDDDLADAHLGDEVTEGQATEIDNEMEGTIAANSPVIPTEDPLESKGDEAKRKKMLSLKFSKEMHRAVEHLSQVLNLSKTEVVEVAVALFYRNYFEREFAQIADLQVFVDELNTLVAENTDQVGTLMELGVHIADAEAELPVDLGLGRDLTDEERK